MEGEGGGWGREGRERRGRRRGHLPHGRLQTLAALLALRYGENFIILTSTVLDDPRVMDRWTDGRTSDSIGR